MSKELDDYMDAFNGWKDKYGLNDLDDLSAEISWGTERKLVVKPRIKW